VTFLHLVASVYGVGVKVGSTLRDPKMMSSFLGVVGVKGVSSSSSSDIRGEEASSISAFDIMSVDILLRREYLTKTSCQGRR